jgi:hypothetical protein
VTPFQWFILGVVTGFPVGACFAMAARAVLDRFL